MPCVLLVDDNEDLTCDLQPMLESAGYTVEVAHRGSDARKRLEGGTYNVIILDWDLPDTTGIEICKEYRANAGCAPILMLTGNAQVSQKEIGLDAGADDYLVKPFKFNELSARLEALQRRANRPLMGNILKHADVQLDPASFRVTRAGQPVKLVPKEFALLEFLMRNARQVFSAEDLIERVWTSDEEVSPETVRTHIKNLRKKLDQPGSPSLIENVHGSGYRLIT